MFGMLLMVSLMMSYLMSVIMIFRLNCYAVINGIVIITCKIIRYVDVYGWSILRVQCSYFFNFKNISIDYICCFLGKGQANYVLDHILEFFKRGVVYYHSWLPHKFYLL